MVGCMGVTFIQNNHWPLCCILRVSPGDAATDLPLSTKTSKVTSAVVKTRMFEVDQRSDKCLNIAFKQSISAMQTNW